MPPLKITYFSFIILTLLMSCTDQNTSNEKEEETVEGSWDLIKYVDHDLDKQWKSHGDSIMYQKHITPNSFVWLNFDKKNERLIGMGGGTIEFTGDQYTEYIAFFYPPIESLIGQPIPFDVEFKDGQWLHTGYFVNEITDIETGEVVERDTVKIEEIWERTKAPVNENTELVGTWQLQSYKETMGEPYIEYPDFIGSLKLVTSTHFTWIKYDRHGDEVYAAGSGTYTYNDEAYTEEIHMIYPENTGQIGKSLDFRYNVEDDQWYHFGYVPSITIESGIIVKDSALIDEYWEPFKNSDVKDLLL